MPRKSARCSPRRSNRTTSRARSPRGSYRAAAGGCSDVQVKLALLAENARRTLNLVEDLKGALAPTAAPPPVEAPPRDGTPNMTAREALLEEGRRTPDPYQPP